MKAWERQEGESNRAFEAFRCYLDRGVERSTAKVAQSLGKSKALMDRWSSRWNWVERVIAYQSHITEIADKSREQETAKLARKIISKNEVLEELTLIAECDWREFVELKYGQDGEILNANLRLGDKLKALELAGKYHKLFTDKIEHSGLIEAFTKLKSEFPDVAETELKAWFAELVGTQDLGAIG